MELNFTLMLKANYNLLFIVNSSKRFRENTFSSLSALHFNYDWFKKLDYLCDLQNESIRLATYPKGKKGKLFAEHCCVGGQSKQFNVVLTVSYEWAKRRLCSFQTVTKSISAQATQKLLCRAPCCTDYFCCWACGEHKHTPAHIQ